MDWGIVTSVLVAMVIFILAIIAIGLSVFTLFARKMRRQIEAGGIPKCPMPGCPFHEKIVDAIKTTKSEE